MPEARAAIRILLVEDSEDDALIVLRALRKGGLTLDWRRVQTIADLRRALADDSWDLVISDFNLPGFCGLDSLAVLRETGIDIPFILVSGAMGEETAVKAMKAGASDYLSKDSLGRLAPAVERELAEAAGRRRRREAEKALAASETKYRNLIEQSLQGLVVVDETQLVLVNRRFAEILDYEVDELIGLPRADLMGRLVHPEERKRIANYLSRRLRGEPVTKNYETRLLTKKGKIKWVEIYAGPVVIDEKRMLQYAIVDVQERKILEEQLLHAQKMEAIGRLAGGVAHDFNNMLGAILGSCEMALDSIPAGTELHGDIKGVQLAAERAATLTRQLLAFSRKQVHNPRVIDLNHSLTEMESLLRRLIGENVDLSFHCAENLGHVCADPTQMSQVIMNLAVNARDAMDGHGKLTVTTENIEILPSQESQSDGLPHASYIVLTVADDGCGMNEATRERIFEPFFTTKGEDLGTGLGLSTVYGIVEQNGGHVTVKSAEGLGTTMKIHFPRIEAPLSRTQSLRTTVVPARGETTTILIAEDETLIRNLAKRILENAGYRTLVAECGEDALSICESHRGPIHLLLTDMIMPGMTGRELFERLFAMHRVPAVIYMSGYAQDVLTSGGDLAPNENFLNKPFRRARLVEIVHRILDDDPGRATSKTAEIREVRDTVLAS